MFLSLDRIHVGGVIRSAVVQLRHGTVIIGWNHSGPLHEVLFLGLGLIVDRRQLNVIDPGQLFFLHFPHWSLFGVQLDWAWVLRRVNDPLETVGRSDDCLGVLAKLVVVDRHV